MSANLSDSRTVRQTPLEADPQVLSLTYVSLNIREVDPTASAAPCRTRPTLSDTDEATDRAEPADPEPILAADRWRTNGHLIADVARLYLRPEWRMIDPTYGRGLWWTEWRPAELVTHDRRLDGIDFRDLPYDAGTFDAAAFDPPYVSVGGRKTTTLTDLHDRYGLTDAPTSPPGVQALIDEGLAEVARVVRRRGVILVKCQDYVSSGRLWPGTHHTLTAALGLGLELVDRLEHVGNRRAQPPGRRQVHARRNLSTLFVLRRPRR